MSEVAEEPTRRSRSWQEVRATRKPREDRVAGHKDRMLAETRALRLREMREEQGLTQVELAARMHVTQPSISALERGDLEKAGLATTRPTSRRSAARSR